jgi:hypothetical protein
LGRKGREWYLANCGFGDWKKKIKNVVGIYKYKNIVRLGTEYGG